MNLGEPLHIRNAVPSWHHEAKWEPLMLRQRFTIHRIRQNGLRLHGIFNGHTSSEMLINLVGLASEGNVDFPVIGAEKDDFFAFRLHTDGIQQISKARSRPESGRSHALNSSAAVTGAFEGYRKLD